MSADAAFDDFDRAPAPDADAGLRPSPRRTGEPGATYRLQLCEEFGFAAVADLLDYFVDLGITHLYLSPIMRARSGSTHGYDVVDPTVVSPALGGEQGLRELAAAAAGRGIGLIADIVPNHLAASDESPLWEQLLADGMSSFAGTLFDVDWRPPLPTAEGKVILPVLGEPYGETLTSGALTLARIGGVYRLRYGDDRTFPLRRETLARIDAAGGGKAFAGTPGAAASWRPLHDLLEQQHYRLVHWRIGPHVINYRRFFLVDDLAAVRVGVPEVFEHLHATMIDLVADGVISGLRVDHPDGLHDPERYLQQLRNRTGVWIVAEKILHPGERLPDWPVAGTTGYDFCTDVLGLYVDADAMGDLLDVDRKLGGGTPYEEHAVAAKRAVLEGGLAADLERITTRLWAVTQQRPQVRDVTLDWCGRVLACTLEQFGVYRTYVDPETGAARDADRAEISAAIARAREVDPHPPAQLWDFLAELLCGEAGSPAGLDVLARFQQLSSVVMAKGTEDAAFYRYRPLLAPCEVGGDPAEPGRTVEDFQQANALRAERHPAALLSTATHDSKRGEDTRLRIAALSEVADAWRSAVEACEALELDTRLPAQSRQLVYQTAIGLWPLQGDPEDPHRDRLADYVVKAEREAGIFTTWTAPDEAFEERVREFARTMLSADTVPEEFSTVVERCAEIAMVSGLGQVVLRTMSPGVPDLYQGTELWDDALVDPDNRRAVPFDARRAALDTLSGDVSVETLLHHRRDGRIKLLVLWRALAARAAHPDCVGVGSGYLPLTVTGRWAEHVVGFARVAPDGSDALLVVAPRLPGAVMGEGTEPPLGDAWADTTLQIPGFLQGNYRDIFSTGAGEVGDGLNVAAVLGSLPVAVLARM